MSSFQNGTSEPVKRDNWDQVCRIAAKHGLDLPSELVTRVMSGAPGAAVQLCERLYEHCTGKRLPRINPEDLQSIGQGTEAAAAAAAAAAKAAAAAAPTPSFGQPPAGEGAEASSNTSSNTSRSNSSDSVHTSTGSRGLSWGDSWAAAAGVIHAVPS